MKKTLKIVLLSFIVLFLICFTYFFIGSTDPAENIVWGVNFSQKHAVQMGIDWQAAYLALVDDLKVKNLKIASYWDYIEKTEGEYDFTDLDWQMLEAEKRGVRVFLVIGIKTSRWPECHEPSWARSLSKEDQQEKIMELLERIVLRYRDSEVIWAWQVENEPFFPFGECQWVDRGFLKKEINLVRSLDSQNRPIIITDSGEASFWITAARYGDMVGTTMYKKVWFEPIGFYLRWPFPSIYYHRKAEIIRKVFDKEVIGVELQAEPWGPTLLYGSSMEEQEKTMNLEQFKYNIEFARNTGLKEFYLWGSEWWYWMKEKQNQPEIWEETRKLFGE